MLKQTQILNNIAELKNIQSNRVLKYRRNFRYYNGTKYASLENIRNPVTVGINLARELGEEEDTSINPQLNIIASIVDTLTSKISQSKVRPFFNTINGTFKDIQVVKQAQQFFDVFYDEQNVNKKISESFKDAAIFDTGVIYVDDENYCITKALPFQVYTRPAENTYGKITRVYYERKDYPVTLLPEKVYKKFKNKSLEYVDYGIYYDIFNKTKAYTANGTFVLAEEYDKDVIPFVFIYYKIPSFGNSTISVADATYAIQDEINILMAKIKDASQLNSALTHFVPEGSDIKVTQLNNRTGNVVKYKPIPGVTNPIHSATQQFIDNQYITLLEKLIEKAYELNGISMLSAQSKKPTGIESGIALSTLEDVESDRFETQLNQIIRMYVDVCKTCIAVFDPNANILPEIASRTNVKWKELVKESKNMNIQYSAADSLSKDPSTKLEQLQQLAMAGIIPTSRISQFLQLPDLEQGYSLSNNAIDAVMEIIKECVEDDNFDVPEYIPFVLLKEEIINTQLSLRSAGPEENKEAISKLTKLYQKVEELEQQWNDEAAAVEQAEKTNNLDTAIPQQTNVLTQEANMTPNVDITPEEKSTNDSAAWVNEHDFNRV